MMHYRKGDNIAKETKKEELPFKDCLPKGQENFLWMHVNGGTKVNNVITYAKNALDKGEYRTIVWSGHGGGVVKTVSCAEIIKRTHPLYQVTRMDYKITEEHWLPIMDNLEEIVVTRKVPAIHILMSLEAINDVEGVQKPNTKTDYWDPPGPSNSRGFNQRNGTRRQNQQYHGQRQRKFKRKENQQKEDADENVVQHDRNQKRKHKKSEGNSDNRENKKTTEPKNT
ncbi:ribonuclease P protein subunit p25-like protein [Teleopsis dalmanni]|uniref:ribonuclease P protein subunit p25-like protein n=1 Tax=Teleopsis dalmanni TaxID=139649 RepID=UPI0018CD1DC7|nr:ribonuclease P protein subunit p25-like protein [Teleopsis dalmanni]